MSRRRIVFGFEPLEQRRLMAVIEVLPAEATAEYAPTAPHGMMDPGHMDSAATDIAIPAASNIPYDVSISVEPSASWNVLMVQFAKLPETQFVGLAGGAAGWTDADGAIHFEVPLTTRQFELTIAGERFLRIAVDGNGRIESYARLDTGNAATDQPVTSIGDTGNTPNAIHTGMGISMFTPTGAALDHHASAMLANTTTDSAASELGPLFAGDHSAMEAGTHSAGMTDELAAVEALHVEGGNVATGSNAAMASAVPSTDNGTLAVQRMSQQSESETSSSSPKASWVSASEEDTIDAVFATWAGGEETAPQETIATIDSLSESGAAPANIPLPQPRSISNADRTTMPAVAAVVEELDAEAGGDETDIDAWRASVAIVFSAGCAVGAYALEQRAQQPTSESTRATRRRPRHHSAPVTGSAAKAAM